MAPLLTNLRSEALDHCADLVTIYQDEIGLCLWTPPDCHLRNTYGEGLAKSGFHFQRIIEVADFDYELSLLPDGEGVKAFRLWMKELVEMFATLFGLDHVGFRISSSERPICPKFHVDRVPVRLVHSLCGDGCQWIEDSEADGNAKKMLEEANKLGSYQVANTQKAPSGAVVLMKGARWNEETPPVVHRSPPHSEPRAVLTLDFA